MPCVEPSRLYQGIQGLYVSSYGRDPPALYQALLGPTGLGAWYSAEGLPAVLGALWAPALLGSCNTV